MTVTKATSAEIINVVDVVSEIVDSVRTKYDVSNEKPYFMHGHPLEIINTLKEYTQSSELRLKKFPLIALFEDIDSNSPSGIFASVSKLNVLIITDTSPNYKAAERYTQSFNQVLTPIYDLFISECCASRRILTPKNKIQHERVNHLFWGNKGLYGNTANFFEDTIDAIEIKNLDFKVFR